jgi:hypothetical protein
LPRLVQHHAAEAPTAVGIAAGLVQRVAAGGRAALRGGHRAAGGVQESAIDAGGADARAIVDPGAGALANERLGDGVAGRILELQRVRR